MTLTITFIMQLIVLLVGVLVFCTGYLIIMRILEDFGLRKKDAYIHEKQMLWYRYFREEEDFDPTLIPKNQYEVQAVEEIFSAYINNLITPAISEKIRLFANQYLKQHIAKKLKSRRWGNRINAMNLIVDFQMDSLLEDCEKMDGHKLSHEEHFQRLNIYAVFKNTKFVKELFFSPMQFSEYEYKRLFMNVDEESLSEIIGRMASLPATCQYALIDILGTKGNIDDLPFLESQLNHANDEIRIRSLKAIYKIGMVIDPKKYVRFTTSPIWEERLMHTKVLGNLSFTYALPYLQQLLQDDSWWVRLQAAEIIGKDKRSTEILQRFIETANDPYAIDMAREVLARRA